MLAEPGYAPIEAAEGASARKVIQSGLYIDLLITDVGLPNGINGAQRERWAECPSRSHPTFSASQIRSETRSSQQAWSAGTLIVYS